MIVPFGLQASVQVSADSPSLYLGLKIYDDSGVSPVQVTGLPGMVGGVLPMANFANDSYRAKFSGTPGNQYVVNIAAYTDNTYSVVSGAEAQDSQTIYFASNSGPVVVAAPVVAMVSDDSGEAGTPARIFTGSDSQLNVCLRSDATSAPFDLTNASEIALALPKADGTDLKLLLSNGDIVVSQGASGVLAASISAANSALLQASDDPVDLQVSVTIGGKKTVVVAAGAILISAPPYSGAL